MKRLKTIIKNEYIYSIVTKIISLGIALIQSVLVARYLGPKLQGTSAYITSIVSIGAIIITFGMHQAYPYFRKKYGKNYIYNDFISLIYLLYGTYFFLSIILSTIFITDSIIKIIIILIPIYGYDRIVSYIVLIEEPNKRNTWWTIIGIIDILFVICLMCFIKKSLLSATMILLFAELIKSIIYTILLKAKPLFNKKLFRLSIELLKMGFFPMLALLMTTLNYKIDIIMLKSFKFITVEQIGIYSIGMNFADKIVLIPDTLKGVLVSRLSKGADEKEVAKVSRLCFWTSICVCSLFLIFGKKIIGILYGPKYNGAYKILNICALGSIFVGYFKLIAQYNIVEKKQIRNVILLSFSIIINIFLNYILIPKFQLNGAAFASGVGYFISGIIFVVWFAKSNCMKISSMFFIKKEDINTIKKFIKKGEKK